MEAYQLSNIQKRVLNYAPKYECCLSGLLLNDLKNLLGKIIFVWFKNKKGCWFYLETIRGNTLYGYALIGIQWKDYKINLSGIHAYY